MVFTILVFVFYAIYFFEKSAVFDGLSKEMPKQVQTPKEFLALCQRSDAKWIHIKKAQNDMTKFKLRTTKYLYTLSVKPKFVELVRNSIPEQLECVDLDKKE